MMIDLPFEKIQITEVLFRALCKYVWAPGKSEGIQTRVTGPKWEI